MDSEQQKLKRAVAALKSGDKAAAWKLFAEILRENPSQAEAWIGLSLSTSRQERRREYLQRALRVNPGHVYARTALARLEHPPALRDTVSLPPIVKAPEVKRRWMEVYISLGLLVLILFSAITGLGFFFNQQSRVARMASMPSEVPAHHYVFIEFYADW